MNKIICFSTHEFEKEHIANYCKKYGLKIKCVEKRLDMDTVHLASGYNAALCWAKDDLGKDVLSKLHAGGTKMIGLRSAGYSHLDIELARQLNLTVARVPSYSPESIAEHAVALYLALNRKIVVANQRVRNHDFRLEGLGGSLVHGKTVGVIGSGKIGSAFIEIMKGFGCKILITDHYKNPKYENDPKCRYVSLDELLTQSDIISLHCPLTKDNKHLINKENINKLKESCILINTSRGGLIETPALIESLKKKKISAVGLDVYEFEENIFSNDFSSTGIEDDNLARLLTFPNVLVTSHQAFFTKEAVQNIVRVSLENVLNFFNNTSIEKENLLLSPLLDDKELK
jgi:D-lactate dehydrogenase